MDAKWPREEEEYLMKVSDQCQDLSTKYNEIYNTYKVHETRFKLPVIVLGSVIGMLSFGASQFGNDNTDRITIGVGVSSIVISIISSIEAYLKIGETMTNSLVTATQLKKLKEKIDIELAILPEYRTSSSTVFLRQCHGEYMDIIEKAPPLQFKGILSRLRKSLRRAATSAAAVAQSTNLQARFRSIVEMARNQRLAAAAAGTSSPPDSPSAFVPAPVAAPVLNPVVSKFQSMVSLEALQRGATDASGSGSNVV